MTQFQRDTLHEILGSLIILKDVVDDNLQTSVASMCESVRNILDEYWEEE